MAISLLPLSRKVINAINTKYGAHLVMNTSEFFRNGDVIRMKVVKDSFYSGEGDYCDKELFRTASAVYALLFLVDALATLDGRELEDHQNEGYKNLFEKKAAQLSLDYLKEEYSGKDR